MRTKIDYGIDLGTTNSSIARMEGSQPVIKKTDFSTDVLPSCVHFTKKKDLRVGQRALKSMNDEIINALENFIHDENNSFIEFKRTMGTDHKYYTKNMGREFSSEELSAEVLKTLKSFILDDQVDSVVITVPAKFITPQKEATIKAAKRAGFKHVELLTEPVAASTAYGLSSKSKDAIWIVFDFGGGTFDAALVKAEDGILSVKDTDGDNFLGGKNLDEAIVDNIIMPYLKKNYSIDFILKDETKREILRRALKFRAEEAKIQLSFMKSYHMVTDINEFKFKDENGNEPEIDITVTQEELEKVLSPIFQKAIDITKALLRRNNIKESDISSLILVGGPTHSPILRKMLREQVTKNVDTSIDPMTAVARGAALVASTLSVSEEVLEEKRDKTKIQLDLKYDSATVETHALVTLKILKDKTEGEIPEQVFAEIVRSDGGFSSNKKTLGEKATLLELQLAEGRSNLFNINLFDNFGNVLECQPNQLSILQGLDPGKMTTLPYHICIVKHFFGEEKDLIAPVMGLEKNKKIPVTGVVNGLKTRREIRPGISNDIIRIPIYQGEYNSEGTSPKLNHLVFEVIISGESLPALLPLGSSVDLTMKIDRSEHIKFSAYFPAIEHTEEVDIEVKNIETPTEEYLISEINSAIEQAKGLDAEELIDKLEQLKIELENKRGSADGRIQINENLKREMFALEQLSKTSEWPAVEEKLKNVFYELEDLISKIEQYPQYSQKVNLQKLHQHTSDFRKKVEKVVLEKSVKDAKELTKVIDDYDYEIRNLVTENQFYVDHLKYLDKNFQNYHWIDRNEARTLINEGLKQIAAGNNHSVRNLIVDIYKWIPENERPLDTLI